MNDNKVSIIIPTYNRADLIKETLQSVASQTFENWECIVVDDGSEDHTEGIVNEFVMADDRFSYVKRPPHLEKGANACRNFGHSLATGNFIQWFDSDDLLHDANLEKKINALADHPNRDLCVHRFELFEQAEEQQKVLSTSNIKGRISIEDWMERKVSISLINTMFTKTFLEKFQEPIFNEQLQQSQDLEFFARVFHKQPNFMVLDEVLTKVRVRHHSISNEAVTFPERYLDSYLLARRKVMEMFVSNPVVNREICRQVNRIFRLMLSNRQYENCERCLAFLQEYVMPQQRPAYRRIHFVYKLVKLLGGGSTRFKKLLKL